MHALPAAIVPPPLPRSRTSMRLPSHRAWIIFVVFVVSVCGLSLEYAWLRGRRIAQIVAQANRRVRDEIETARAGMAVQHWDEAVLHLETALSIERATNRDSARSLLDEARRGQADALLEAANLAAANKNASVALRLVRAYLVHPQAANLDRARRLRDDLTRAVSSDEAATLLARLSDDALNLFQERGQLVEEDGLHTSAAREIFKDTLRKCLTLEIRKRQTRRELARRQAEHRAEKRAKRIAELRYLPAFRDLLAFVERSRDQVHERRRLAQRQEAELGQLFQQLDISNTAEQNAIRADLLGRDEHAVIGALVDRKRAAVKRAYRSSVDFNATDGALFDRLVDDELDKLLKTLK